MIGRRELIRILLLSLGGWSVPGVMAAGTSRAEVPAQKSAPLQKGQPDASLGGSVLVLVPDAPFDPLYPLQQAHLKQVVGKDMVGPLHDVSVLLGKVGNDPGAWRQAAAFVRASLWFSYGRQGLQEHDAPKALLGLKTTREILENAGLVAKAPLLASIELLSGQIKLDSGDEAGAVEAFRTACIIDPNDLSAQLNPGPALALYAKARQWVQEAEKRPVRIQVNTEGPGAVTLTINGARVMGNGPLWLIELTPGRHLIGALREGTRPSTRALVLPPLPASKGDVSAGAQSQGAASPLPSSGIKTPEVYLRLEPGRGGQATMRPFSLAEANAIIEACQKLRTRYNAARLVLGVGTRTSPSQEAANGPKVGVQSGIRLNPGPDAGDDAPPVVPVELEIFSLEASGAITLFGQSTLRP